MLMLGKTCDESTGPSPLLTFKLLTSLTPTFLVLVSCKILWEDLISFCFFSNTSNLNSFESLTFSFSASMWSLKLTDLLEIPPAGKDIVLFSVVVNRSFLFTSFFLNSWAFWRRLLVLTSFSFLDFSLLNLFWTSFLTSLSILSNSVSTS